jgi:hypothetical protein
LQCPSLFFFEAGPDDKNAIRLKKLKISLANDYNLVMIVA